MVRGIDKGGAILLSVVLLALLGCLGAHEMVSFDAAYNLLSYQNLWHGLGFHYAFGDVYRPFDPVITTGPELYLPTLLLWSLTGHDDYYLAVVVLLLYHAALFAFLLAGVLRGQPFKTVTLGALALTLALSKPEFLSLCVQPLGEPVAGVLAVMGFWLLHQRRWPSGFLLLGLAIDAKANLVIALAPVAGLLVLRQLWDAHPTGGWAATAKAAARAAGWSMLLFLPYLCYRRLLPALVLSGEDERVFQAATVWFTHYQLQGGFGQLLDLLSAGPGVGGADFVQAVVGKLRLLRSWWADSALLVGLGGAALLALTGWTYRRRDPTFPLFATALGIAGWWLCGPPGWYRYFFLVEWFFALGLVLLIPGFLARRQWRSTAAVGLLLLVGALSQGSREAFARCAGPTPRPAFNRLTADLNALGATNVFAYGWYQCPQVMLWGNVRFPDAAQPGRLRAALEAGAPAHLLTTSSSAVEPRIQALRAAGTLVQDFGWGLRLYRLDRDAADVLEPDQTL